MQASLTLIRFESNTPSVIAGLMWQPDTPPIAYAIATTARPNATAVPTTAAVFSSAHPSETAAPQPRNVSTNVPTNSARYFLIVV